VSFYEAEDDNSESITRQKCKEAAGLPPRHEDLRATPFSELMGIPLQGFFSVRKQKAPAAAR